MAKATKREAREAYDRFFSVKRNLNGGTTEENERQAPFCYERLQQEAAIVARLVANPGKLLRNDVWLWEAVSETIPARLEAFRIRYGL